MSTRVDFACTIRIPNAHALEHWTLHDPVEAS